MKRIVTITKVITHFVDILTDADTEAEARTEALRMAGEDVRFWDEEAHDSPQAIAVRPAEDDASAA